MCIGQGQQAGPAGTPPAVASTGADALKIGDPTAARTSGIGRLMLRLTGNGGGSGAQQSPSGQG